MSDELLKELQLAGFIFKEILEGQTEHYWGTKIFVPGNGHVYIVPNLEELIDACGESFIGLDRIDGGFRATGIKLGPEKIIVGEGSTPAEAVARLWLALNAR